MKYPCQDLQLLKKAADEEVNEEIEKMAKQYGQDGEKFKESLNANQIDMIKNDTIISKTVDFLVQNAKTTA